MCEPTKHQPPEALEAAAIAASQRAYAPYSGFCVGAAILADNGRIYSGCNVENASYPEGNCAETSAIAAMVLDGGRRIVQIVVFGPGDVPVTPCGGCRQRLREFCEPDTPIFCSSTDGGTTRFTLSDLLPQSFGPQFLAGQR